MATKTVTKQRTVDYETTEIHCDLCEAVLPTGQTMITLTPAVAEGNGSRYAGVGHIDICSVDCLVKNAGAAGLVLNTNLLPELRDNYATRGASRKKSTDYDELSKFVDIVNKEKKYVGSPMKQTWGLYGD